MPKPPHWLPWLGPIFAGVAAGLAVHVWPFAGFGEVVLVAVAAGLIPSVGQVVWRKLWERKMARAASPPERPPPGR